MLIKKTYLRRTVAGFTLVELLLVMTLLPIVFFSVYSNFSAGFNLWARIVRETPEEDLDIFYYKTRKDLENMRRFSTIPFDGDKEELSFAATVSAPPELGGENGLGKVRIYYDEDKHIIFRESRNYSQVAEDTPGEQSVLLKDVNSFELSYFSKSPLESTYSWEEAWKPEPKKLPVAIKMTFSLEGIPGKQERTVFIPAGGLIS